MTFRQRVKRFRYRYEHFVEKQGFPIIMGVCIAVIVLSAVWSGQMEQTLPAPTSPAEQIQSAAGLQQESLAQAALATPSPAPQPETVWHPPLKKMIVLQPFQQSRMTQSSISGLWQVHDGVDLQSGYGEPVASIADGNVQSVTDEGILGVSITISHADGYTSTYANLSAIAGVKVGDPVKAEQTIGFCGRSMLEEKASDAHLHLIVQRDGQNVDPMLLFSGQ